MEHLENTPRALLSQKSGHARFISPKAAFPWAEISLGRRPQVPLARSLVPCHLMLARRQARYRPAFGRNFSGRHKSMFGMISARRSSCIASITSISPFRGCLTTVGSIWPEAVKVTSYREARDSGLEAGCCTSRSRCSRRLTGRSSRPSKQPRITSSSPSSLKDQKTLDSVEDEPRRYLIVTAHRCCTVDQCR